MNNRPEVTNPNLARTVLVGLTVECPQGDNCESCPLYEKRKLDFLAKFEWVKSLPDEELLELYSTHCACLEIKESA